MRMRRNICILLLVIGVCLLAGCASLKINPHDKFAIKITKGVVRVPLEIVSLGMSERYFSVERTMTSWLGHHQSELLMSWGPPSQIMDDGSGGKIIVYTQVRSFVSPGYSYSTTTGSASAYGYGNTAYAYGSAQTTTTSYPAQVHQRTTFRQFHVDSSGVIRSYSWRGL